MKHLLHLGGIEYTYDGELPCSHVVIGQRDVEKENPNINTSKPLSQSDHAKLSKFVHDQTSGRFAVKPLEWCESETEAKHNVKRFRADGCINIRIAEVNAVIENA